MKKLFLLSFCSLIFANNIVIYNNNLSYVNEERNITLQANKNFFYIKNLSFDIIDSSINLKSSSLKILSYELKKANSFDKKLLELNLNKSVDFLINKKIKSGELIQIEPRVIIKSEDKYYLINDINSIIFRQIPKNYQKKPYLKVKIANSENKKSLISLNYLLNNISWSSNYILDLKNEKLDLKSYIEINNQSSKSFRDFNISFVAGELNRINRYNDEIAYISSPAPMMRKSLSVNIKEQKIDSYYIYNLPYKESIIANSKKTFLLFKASNIKYKSYYEAKSNFFRNGERRLKFTKVIEFKNSKKNHLGLAMPQGVVRVYANNIYLGEDFIKNSSVEDDIKIKSGIEFDLSGKVKVVKFEKSKNYQKSTKEYILKNSSKKDKILKIYEDIPSYQEADINFGTSCKDICKNKTLTAFLRVYEIKLKAKSEYRFKSTYEIFYK